MSICPSMSTSNDAKVVLSFACKKDHKKSKQFCDTAASSGSEQRGGGLDGQAKAPQQVVHNSRACAMVLHHGMCLKRSELRRDENRGSLVFLLVFLASPTFMLKRGVNELPPCNRTQQSRQATHTRHACCERSTTKKRMFAVEEEFAERV